MDSKVLKIDEPLMIQKKYKQMIELIFQIEKYRISDDFLFTLHYFKIRE